jgi:signal transduction histidine kinase
VIEAVSPFDGIARTYAAARAGATNCVAVIALPSVALYQPARDEFRRYVIASVFGVILATIAALLVARRIVWPVRRLHEVAARFGAGDFGVRATAAGGGEVAELAAAFNAMANLIAQREAKLAEVDHLKSEFVSSVSHELRTPLTTIKTLTRVLLRGQANENERREYLETIAAECDRQIALVVNLLDLTGVEAGRLQLLIEPLDALSVARECVERMQTAAHERRQTLALDAPATLPQVFADHAALGRVVCGLIDNAIKYTPEGGSISVTFVVRTDQLGIAVTDTGRGIRSEDLPRIFDKFYRGQSPVSMSEPGVQPMVTGVGLGLYLGRMLVEQMGGTLEARTEPGRGSTFTVWLRIASETDY